MKTHFKIFVRNETDDWSDEMRRKAGHAIFRAYLFDALRSTYACEITPSYEMWPLYTTPYKDDEEGNVAMEIMDAEDSEVIYIHCHRIDAMSPGNFYDFGEEEHEEEDWDEIREAKEEYCRGNVMIEFPKGFSVVEITYRFDEEDLKSEWKKNANWQVIFKILNDDGVVRDYCRETRLRSDPLEEVERWAIAECAKHKLCGADIQLF